MSQVTITLGDEAIPVCKIDALALDRMLTLARCSVSDAQRATAAEVQRHLRLAIREDNA